MKIGFDFVPFPTEIWSEGIELSQSEFRLLGWFLSGLRFGIKQADLTDEEILTGTSIEGRKFPPLGLSRNSMKSARVSLMEKKLIIGEQGSDGGGRGKSPGWKYRLNLSNVDTETCQGLTLNQSNSDTFPQLNLSNVDTAIRNVREKQRRAEGRFTPPILEEVKAYFLEKKFIADPVRFFTYYDSIQWAGVKNWKGKAVTWEFREQDRQKQNGNSARPVSQDARPEDSPAFKIKQQEAAYLARKGAR